MGSGKGGDKILSEFNPLEVGDENSDRDGKEVIGRRKTGDTYDELSSRRKLPLTLSERSVQTQKGVTSLSDQRTKVQL